MHIALNARNNTEVYLFFQIPREAKVKAEVGVWILLCEKSLDWITKGPSGRVPSCESRATVFIFKPPKSATGLGPAPGGSCGILPDIQDWKWHHHPWISTFQCVVLNMLAYAAPRVLLEPLQGSRQIEILFPSSSKLRPLPVSLGERVS